MLELPVILTQFYCNTCRQPMICMIPCTRAYSFVFQHYHGNYQYDVQQATTAVVVLVRVVVRLLFIILLVRVIVFIYGSSRRIRSCWNFPSLRTQFYCNTCRQPIVWYSFSTPRVFLRVLALSRHLSKYDFASGSSSPALLYYSSSTALLQQY